MDTFTGECWTQSEVSAKKYGLNRVSGSHDGGLSTKPGHIHFGGNSGYQAINLVYHFGAAEIVLLGYDMGGTHWFGKHPPQLEKGTPFMNLIPKFWALARDLQLEGVEVINCSRESALQCFVRKDLEAVL